MLRIGRRRFRGLRRRSRWFRSELKFRVVYADLALHKMRDMRPGLPFVREFARDAIDQKSAVRSAAAMRRLFDPARDNFHFLSRRFAMARSLSGHILALDPSQKADCQVRVLWVGRSLLLRERQKRFAPSSWSSCKQRSWTVRNSSRTKQNSMFRSSLLQPWPTRWLFTALFMRCRKASHRKAQSAAAAGEKHEERRYSESVYRPIRSSSRRTLQVESTQQGGGLFAAGCRFGPCRAPRS